MRITEKTGSSGVHIDALPTGYFMSKGTNAYLYYKKGPDSFYVFAEKPTQRNRHEMILNAGSVFWPVIIDEVVVRCT